MHVVISEIITFCVITFCVITLCVKKVITICVERLLHFALKILLHFASMLLHFALVLHFAAIRITFCVNITFCGVTTSGGQLSCSFNHVGPFHHNELSSFTSPPLLAKSEGFSWLGTCLHVISVFSLILRTRLLTNCFVFPGAPYPV